MRYYIKDGKEYLENGKALLQVHTVNVVPSPSGQKRVVRILIVRKAITQSWKNPIQEGAMLGMSFPHDMLDCKDYTWFTDEERQVDFQRALADCQQAEGDIDTGNGPKLRDFSKQ